ncbi:hypothetical protein [Desulfovibrio sp. ZJ369]|uniref:hypothetical protein n=1 Tax=Desulfovibrio sp. ZJ369 TaxID=2709793 RepID=UPI0013EC3BB0|nr:hypothetical protein [Desulfovibrio sp. ZJ369]
MWELAEFRRYAEAVNAERYRVTCIKMDEDGGKKTFIIDREYAEAARGKCARPRVIPSARPGDPARACYAHLDNIRRHLTIED